MAIISAGYDGTVDEVQFAGLVPKAGASEYGVDLAGDYAVTAVAGQDRTVSIAPGAAWGHSVIDMMDANETRALAAPVSGSRWDMIVLRRDWQPPGGATTIEVIEGGQTSTTLPSRLMGKGVNDDQPLALVRVDAGSTTIGQIIDLRCWGRNGGVTAKDELVLQYLGAIGAEVRIGRSVYARIVNADNSTDWQKSHETYMKTSSWGNYTLGSGISIGTGTRVNFPDGTFTPGVTPNVQLTVVARTPGYAVGRINVEARNVSHTGFEYWAYRTDLSEERHEIRFTVHWLAIM